MRRLIPLKHVATYNDEVLGEATPPDTVLSYIEISDVSEMEGIRESTPVRFEEAPSRARRVVREGDVLVSTVRTYLRAVAQVPAEHDGAIASTGFAVLRARGVDPRFLKYGLLYGGFMDDVVAHSEGISYPAISAAELVKIKIPVPDSLSEQRAIADYLDRETAEIDAFIAKNEELIALLSERRRAEFLGLMLENPTAVAVKLGAALVKMHRPPHASGSVITAFRDGMVTSRMNRRLDGFTETESDERGGYQGVLPGDLVFHGLDGFAGAVGVSDSAGICSPVYHVCRCAPIADNAFVAYLLRALGQSGFLEASAWSVRQRSVDYRNWSTFAHLRIGLPAIEIQRRIVGCVDELASRSSAAVLTAQRAVDLARERRAALISAAVTGQIDLGVT
ncbi:MAG: restriction endonuclease subunit S domain-containing protein [Propionibacteriaceae bacterium]